MAHAEVNLHHCPRATTRHRPRTWRGELRPMTLLALALSLPWLAGCGDANGGDPSTGGAGPASPGHAASGGQAAAAQVSSDELIQVLGGEVFTVTAPAGTDPAAIAGLALRYGGEDARIDPIGGATGYSAGESLRVVLLRQSGGVVRFGILGSDGLRDGMEATLPDFPAVVVNSKRQGLEGGEWLARFGLTGQPDDSAAEAGEGEADLIFHLQRED